MSGSVVKQQFKTLIVRYRSKNALEVCINRPKAKNAYNRAFYFELLRVLEAVRQDALISIIVFTGVGDTFSAGADLYEIAQYEDKVGYKAGQRVILGKVVNALLNCPKVLVTLVHGASIGISFALNALSDVIYCTETAQFTAPFAQIGLSAEGVSSYTFPAIMGRVKAAEVLLLGKPLTANEALQCNFVARIFPYASLESDFWPFIIKQASLPAHLLQISKRLLRQNERQAILAQLKAEINEMQHLSTSDYHFAQIKKFSERKKSNL